MRRQGPALVQAVSRARSESFTFTSDGDQLVGTLYLPAERPVAAVVTTGPLTSVKEQATGAYAQALAGRGIAALAFDHRTYGESDGEPRQFEDPVGKARDVSAAVTAFGTDERTCDLPVVAVGVCAGAGYMAKAVADDRRLSAFAGVAGYYSDAEAFSTSSPDVYEAAIARGVAAERRWRQTGEAETIPAVAPDGGDVAMPLREAFEFYGTSRGGVDNYTNGFAVQSLAYTTPFDARKKPHHGSGCHFCSFTPRTPSRHRSPASSTRTSPRRSPSSGSTRRVRSTSTTTHDSSTLPPTRSLRSSGTLQPDHLHGYAPPESSRLRR
jgi:uncharacterized protein